MRLDWHRLARGDLIEIVTHIAQESPAAAYRVLEAINEQTSLLTENPEMGRPGRVSGTRELVINRTPHVAAYRIAGGTIAILRVLHGARQWPEEPG